MDGEQRRSDRIGEHLRDGAWRLLTRCHDLHRRAVSEDRGEEREALDVVPVEVAHQAGAVERFVGRKAETEVPESCAHVEHDRLVSGHVDADTRRVAAIAAHLATVARGRSADAVKRHANSAPGGSNVVTSPDGATLAPGRTGVKSAVATPMRLRATVQQVSSESPILNDPRNDLLVDVEDNSPTSNEVCFFF